MRSFLDRMQWKIRNFMIGRYGYDELSKVLVWMALASLILSMLIFPKLFTFIYYICLIYALFRITSRNIYKRQRELVKYYDFIKKPKQFFSLLKRRWNDRHTHKYFKCSCGAYLRVPKGKGKINITCNVCKKVLVRKS